MTSLLAKTISNKCMVKMYCCCIILKLDNEYFIQQTKQINLCL